MYVKPSLEFCDKPPVGKESRNFQLQIPRLLKIIRNLCYFLQNLVYPS